MCVDIHRLSSPAWKPFNKLSVIFVLMHKQRMNSEYFNTFFIMFVLTRKQHMTAEYFNKISIIFVLVRKQRMNAEYFDKVSTIIVLTGTQRMRVGYSTIYWESNTFLEYCLENATLLDRLWQMCEGKGMTTNENWKITLHEINFLLCFL